MVPVRSSTFTSIGYDPKTRELHVRFARAEETYVYLHVEPSVFESFLAAESKGRFFREHVKDTYSYRQVPTS